MVIYFDESYDISGRYFLLGALFNPHPKSLHRQLTIIKHKNNFLDSRGNFKEIKYSNCRTNYHYNIYTEIVDAFAKSTSWFRCIVVNKKILDLEKFGRTKESKSLKFARAYKKFAELLIGANASSIYNATLLVDNLTRCKGDEFVKVMQQEFSVPFYKYSKDKAVPTIKKILSVDSKREQYQLIQVCDLLTGCVLNSLVPTSKYKNMIRDYVIDTFNIPIGSSKLHIRDEYSKFHIWHWSPSIYQKKKKTQVQQS